jgi:hypothetical protein
LEEPPPQAVNRAAMSRQVMRARFWVMRAACRE